MIDYTFKFKEDGLLLNADVPAPFVTPFVDVTRVEGLSNAPYRITERDREGADGGFIDVEFEKPRLIVIDGTIYSPPDQLESYLDSLKYNYAPSNTSYPFYLQAPGSGGRVVFCKSFGVKYDWGTARRIGVTDVQIQLSAEDPAIYDSIPVQASVGLATATEGRSYNKSYNYGYGTPVIGGAAEVYNGGNRSTGATITILGPILNPAIVHDVTSKQLAFDIDLLVGQFLVINLRNRTILLNGTANRRYTLTGDSRWFMLVPGSNSLRLLGADTVSGAPDPVMVVEARGAYR